MIVFNKYNTNTLKGHFSDVKQIRQVELKRLKPQDVNDKDRKSTYLERDKYNE